MGRYVIRRMEICKRLVQSTMQGTPPPRITGYNVASTWQPCKASHFMDHEEEILPQRSFLSSVWKEKFEKCTANMKWTTESTVDTE